MENIKKEIEEIYESINTINIERRKCNRTDTVDLVELEYIGKKLPSKYKSCIYTRQDLPEYKAPFILDSTGIYIEQENIPFLYIKRDGTIGSLKLFNFYIQAWDQKDIMEYGDIDHSHPNTTLVWYSENANNGMEIYAQSTVPVIPVIVDRNFAWGAGLYLVFLQKN